MPYGACPPFQRKKEWDHKELRHSSSKCAVRFRADGEYPLMITEGGSKNQYSEEMSKKADERGTRTGERMWTWGGTWELRLNRKTNLRWTETQVNTGEKKRVQPREHEKSPFGEPFRATRGYGVEKADKKDTGEARRAGERPVLSRSGGG